MKIRIQDGAIYIAPEDDEERQVTEITINTLLRWVAQHDKEKETAMNNTDADTAISARRIPRRQPAALRDFVDPVSRLPHRQG